VSQEDIARYQGRAAEERERALSARDPRVARTHADLAEKYDAVAEAYLKLQRRP
jgi:hypothetical protein